MRTSAKERPRESPAGKLRQALIYLTKINPFLFSFYSLAHIFDCFPVPSFKTPPLHHQRDLPSGFMCLHAVHGPLGRVITQHDTALRRRTYNSRHFQVMSVTHTQSWSPERRLSRPLSRQVVLAPSLCYHRDLQSGRLLLAWC